MAFPLDRLIQILDGEQHLTIKKQEQLLAKASFQMKQRALLTFKPLKRRSLGDLPFTTSKP